MLKFYLFHSSISLINDFDSLTINFLYRSWKNLYIFRSMVNPFIISVDLFRGWIREYQVWSTCSVDNFLQMIVLVNWIPLKPERITRLENYDHGQFVNGRSFPNVLLALATRVFSLQVRSFGKSCRLLSTRWRCKQQPRQVSS